MVFIKISKGENSMIDKQNIINIPVSIAGISLGFLTIATVWELLGFTYIRHFAVVFASISICLLLLKLILNHKKVISELENPVTGSLYFTTTMTLMAISNYLSNYNLVIAKFIWLTAIVLHIMMFVTFIIFMKKDFKFKKVLPSWFVPAVGICVSVVTGKPMGFDSLTKIIFYYSFTWLLILLPIIIYRVKFYKPEIPMQAKMTLAIFAAPSNLCLAGYLGVFDPSNIILMVLVPISYMFTLYVYSVLPKLLAESFTLGFAPLTFPLAIGVVATQRYITYLSHIGSTKWIGILTQIFFMQLIIATLVIGYIVYKTLEMSVTSLRKNLNQKLVISSMKR